MAKYIQVGSYIKPQTEDKNGNPIPKDKQNPYIKIAADVNLKQGQYINLDTKKKLEARLASSETSEKAKEVLSKKVENWPDWLLAELVLTVKD